MMRALLLAAVLAVSPLAATAAETLQTDIVKLELKGDWQRGPSADPEQFIFSSRERGVSLTISTMTFKPSTDLEPLARKLREARLEGEQAAANRYGVTMEIAEPQLNRAERGWHLQYRGKDDKGRHFHYYGIVVPGKLLNIYAESPNAGFEQLAAVLQDIFASLQF